MAVGEIAKHDDGCIREDRVRKAINRMVDGPTAQRLAETFKVLGDPTRVRILSALAMGELCVGEIAEALSMTQSAISHQLRILRALRLVKFQKRGRSVFYSLDDEHIERLFQEGLNHVTHD